MVLVKNWNFFHSLILGKIGLEILFANTLDRKEGFVQHKNLWFWSKIGIFFILCFGQISLQNIVCLYSR